MYKYPWQDSELKKQSSTFHFIAKISLEDPGGTGDSCVPFQIQSSSFSCIGGGTGGIGQNNSFPRRPLPSQNFWIRHRICCKVGNWGTIRPTKNRKI